MKNDSILWNGISVSFSYASNSLCIVDSYRFKKSDMMPILQAIRKTVATEGYLYSRSYESWETEWRAHNVLYDLGIARERTGSVDLNEDESKFRLFCYKILSVFCK